MGPAVDLQKKKTGCNRNSRSFGAGTNPSDLEQIGGLSDVSSMRKDGTCRGARRTEKDAPSSVSSSAKAAP